MRVPECYTQQSTQEQIWLWPAVRWRLLSSSGPDTMANTGYVMQVFKVQPEYARDLWDTGPALATNLQDVEQTCKQAAEGLSKDSSNAQLLSGLSGEAPQPLSVLCSTKKERMSMLRPYGDGATE